jgi:hypothetical protein
MIRILLQPLDPAHANTLGAVIMGARVQITAKMICDDTFGIEDVDWKVDRDSSGIGITFLNANDAMRFKLAWNPNPNGV